MRILAIRGRNLASLAQPFEVELARGALANAGLFAISGPVGAGKSTLLDALCLALFDRTPRLKGRGGTLIGDEGQDPGDWLRANDPRTLLRRNAAEGFAEVDFIGRDGGRWRARWSVRRARRRPDGRLQDQEMTLTDLSRDLLVASGRRSEVLAAIQQRLGLDFDQFCRSVLLAQGEFHAFLHATADERARLLESLTGAWIYRRLSRAAHERRREHEQRVAELQRELEQCDVFDAEARAKLERDARQFDRQIALCDQAIAKAQEYLTWHNDAENRRQHEADAAAALQAALDAEREAQPRRERLQRTQRALAAVPRWELASEDRRKAAAAAEAVAEVRRELETAENRAEALRRRSAELARQHFGAVDARAAIVDEFDQWRSTIERWQSSERALAEATQRVDEERRAVQRADAALLRARSAAAVAEQAFERARAELEERERQAAGTDFDRLAAARRQLAERHRSIERRRGLVKQWRDAVSAQAQATERLSGFERQLVAARRAGEVAERELAAARKRLQFAERHHGLDALRAELVDGEPCALCGATEHPAAHEVDVPDLDAARAQAQAAQSAFDTATKALAKIESECAVWRRERERADAALAALERDDARDPECAQRELVDEERRWADEDRELREREQSAERLSRELREARERRAGAERDRSTALTQRDGAEAEVRAARDRLRDATAAVGRIEAVLAELRQGLEPACVGLPSGVAAIAALGERRLAILSAMCQHEQARAAAEQEVRKLHAALEQAEARRREADEAAQRSAAQFAVVAEQNRVTEHDVAMAHRLGPDALHEEQLALDELQREVERCRTELSLRTRLRREHEAHEELRPTLTKAEAAEALEDARRQRQRTAAEQQQVGARLLFDDSMRKRRAELAPKLADAERECDVWRTLDGLIGSSQGQAFAVFAQGLTLDLLLVEANRRLAELARRYRLERLPSVAGKPGELDFVVVDLDMGGTRRSLRSLSGGETFLVSLALALALATLAAPRSRVETLFLDEGFGTLDAHNLEIALGALDSLQASGCQIGVISHVDGLAERIGTSIEVRPQGSGQSCVLNPVQTTT